MLLPSMAESVKASLQPPENLLLPCQFKQGESVWVRDNRPNTVQKWTKAVIESVDGPLNYSVLLDNVLSRQVHVDHIIDCPELPAQDSTSASRSPEEQVDVTVQNVLHDDNHSPSIQATPSDTCPADFLTPSQQGTVHGDSHPLAAGSTDKPLSCLALSPIPQLYTTRKSVPVPVTQPQVCRSSRSVKAPTQLIEEIAELEGDWSVL